MQDLFALPREALVGELLSPFVPESTAAVVAVAAATYTPASGPNALSRGAGPLTRKLTVARELLLRDLHAQMQIGPVEFAKLPADGRLALRDRTLPTFLYNTGARVSEVAGLRVDQLSLTTPAHVRLLGKGGKVGT